MRINCEQVPALLARPVESFTKDEVGEHELCELFWHFHICPGCRELEYAREGHRQFVFGCEGVKRIRPATEWELQRFAEMELPQYAPIWPDRPPMFLLSP